LLAMKIVTKDEYKPFYDKEGSYPTSIGFYATARAWEKDSLHFAKHFYIAEVGGFNDLQGVNFKGFRKKIAYVWLAGFYLHETEDNPFARWAYLHKEKTTLNPHYMPNSADFYYDLCNEEVVERRVAYLLQQVRMYGLDGLFFDWANEEYLYEKKFLPLLRAFKRRHPEKAFRHCIGNFLSKLKQKGILIVTNQAYRNPELLAYTHYDMTESYIATNEKSQNGYEVTRFVPIKEIIHYFTYLSKLKKHYRAFGFKNFIYMNYLAPLFTKGIALAPTKNLHYVYAMTRLSDFIPFIEVPYDHSLERDTIYFANLGEPLGASWQKGKILWRQYRNGLVLIHPPISRARYLKLSTLKDGYLFDFGERVWLRVEKGEVVIKITPNCDNEGCHHIGKVFIYESSLSNK